MLALDAAGSHSIRIGSTRDHVVSLEVALASGQCLRSGQRVARKPRHGFRESPLEESVAIKRMLAGRLAKLLTDNAALIDEKQPIRQFRNRAGYMLRGVLSDAHVSFPRLLVGSEGTLRCSPGRPAYVSLARAIAAHC